MHTSSMKLTSLFLSLMLASSALAAPVPGSGTPLNVPTVGSGVIADNAPAGTMDKLNNGLQGKVPPPAPEKSDPLGTTIKEAAENNPDAANGLQARTPQLGRLTGPVIGLIGGLPVSDLNNGLPIKKRADVPPLAGDAVDNVVDGVSKIADDRAKHGTNNLAVPAPGTVRRRADIPLDGVKVLGKSEIAGDQVEDVVDGKTPEAVGTAIGAAGGLAGRQAPGSKCDKPGIGEGAKCIIDEASSKVDLNKVNDVGSPAKGTTPGAGSTPENVNTVVPGENDTETPVAGTSSPAPALVGGTTDGVKAPSTPNPPNVGDVTKSA